MNKRAAFFLVWMLAGMQLWSGPNEDLWKATRSANVKAVQAALKAGADVNYVGNAGFSCLHAAATDGFLEVVKVLVAAKADVNRKNNQGRTPVELALEVYRTDIVDVLLKNKADLATVRRRLATPEDGNYLLHNACVLGHADAVKAYMSYGADPNLFDAYSRTPLMQSVNGYCRADAAMRPVFLRIAATLIENRADPEKTDSGGLTALSLALRDDGIDMAKTLLPLTKTITARDGIFAIRKRLDDLFPLILPRITDINGKDADGMTMLHHAAEIDNRQAFDILLKFGSDLDARDKWSRSVLQLAAASGDVSIVSGLLDRGVDIDTPGERGMEDSALNRAVRKRHFPMVEFLILKGANTDAGQRLNPIQNAVMANDLEMARFLIERGVDPDGRTDGGMTALLYLPGRAGLDMAKLLVQAGGDVNAVMVSGESVLDRARLISESELAAYFESVGAVSAKDAQAAVSAAKAADSAVESASASSATASTTAIPSIVRKKGDVPGPEDLLKAVWDNDAGMVKTLLARKADPDGLADAGRSPLFYAARQANLEISRMLLDAGAQPDLTDSMGIGALASACETDNLALVRLLVERGASLEQRDYAGQTPLAYAVGQGRRDIASYLIDSGADVNATNNSGQAIILRAKALNDQAMVSLLIARGAVDVPYTPPVRPARKGR